MSTKKTRLSTIDTSGGLGRGGMRNGKHIGNILTSLENERKGNGHSPSSKDDELYIGQMFSLEFPEFTGNGEPYVHLYENGKKFTGMIKGLNRRSINEDMMYDVIIGEINRKKKIINFIESLARGNKIHVRADEKSEIEGKLLGKFLKYNVYIDQQNINGLKASPGDYLYCEVKRLRKDENLPFPRAMVFPKSIISESRYEKYDKVIFRN